ncbi:excinuclease ABC subunit C [Helicobacter sp. 12S02634-8]|uniref:excinuclease ABC subunit UvrC n=1 Tax=Helicobacter sp. 12S02634-8 TaxID=1476199 RepID=UPI000BA53F73|nr:excinuclease ABC subunit UvrC [Helicobacter sp. 12S02634-8]PAF48035.1 excinuclease ABC subunit C [Helicobacter sp. 12S02634-8]
MNSTYLLERLSNLPTSSGVYQYYDAKNKLLYIGKAKNLKNRIKSYFKITDQTIIPNPAISQRIQIMVSQIALIQTILLSNEQEALILENSLIKQLKPKYNILLRDDKTYPYIYIDMSEDFPTPAITRKIIKKKSIKYFGPYPNGAREILESLYELLPLVQKKSCLQGKKACLFYQIHRCPAPCEGKITQAQYHTTIQEAFKLIQNKNKLIALLNSKMHALSEMMRFEEAATYRDRINKLTAIKNFSVIDSTKLYDFDIFALSFEGKNAILIRLFMRGGKIISSSFEHIKSEYDFDENSIYKQAIINYYKEEIPLPPDQILLPSLDTEHISELETYLYKNCHKKIQISIPLKGDKKDLIGLAIKNANEILRLQSNRSYAEDVLLAALKDLLELNSIPFRIEVFDTSHHSGTNNVGGMVVYENMHFIKDAYRHYALSGSDEYSQMREMLTRRAQDFSIAPPPHLWVIDGGKAQVKLAQEILESQGAEVEVIGIAKEKIDAKAHRAKGSAKDILYTPKTSIALKPTDKRLQFLQKLRDEVHRYAITYHRQKKQKEMQKVSLLEQKGIGKASVKKLLDYFGSFEAIQNASSEELTQILGKRAAQIKAHLSTSG